MRKNFCAGRIGAGLRIGEICGTLEKNRRESVNMNETLKVLKERRSIRKYKAEQIKDEELNAILEAGT